MYIIKTKERCNLSSQRVRVLYRSGNNVVESHKMHPDPSHCPHPSPNIGSFPRGWKHRGFFFSFFFFLAFLFLVVFFLHFSKHLFLQNKKTNKCTFPGKWMCLCFMSLLLIYIIYIGSVKSIHPFQSERAKQKLAML